MSVNQPTAEAEVGFIRLIFPSSREEEIAVWWAEFLRSFVGHQVLMLRPDTTFSEIFSWVETHSDDPVEFELAVMEEFSIDEWGSDLHGFLDYLHEMSFREFVEYGARHHEAQEGNGKHK